MKDVVFLSVYKTIPPDKYWDQTLLKELLKDCATIPLVDGLLLYKYKEGIVIIPGAKQAKGIKKINKFLSSFERCKVIITSDEENKFPIDKLKHPNMKVFANYYHKKYKSDITWLPIGPASFPNLPYTEKQMKWFYAGQVNHESRENMVEELKKLDGGLLALSDGFGKGKPKDEYYELTARAKAIPAPGGHVSPDSFRFYEALEVGSIPIPEIPKYWTHLFDDMPMIVVDNWKDIGKEIDHIDNQAFRNQCVAWWQRKKLDIKDMLTNYDGFTTVIIPTSPIKSHPSTEIIDKAIATVRYQLPDSRIIVTFDGVREEQMNRYDDYQEFISRFLWKYNNDNVYPIIFKDHTHQVGMAREALKHVKTDTLVYVEGDVGFVTDKKIDWDYCKGKIHDGTSNMIRFHYQNHIDKEHEYLYHAIDDKLYETSQYSQRPHIASVAYYRRLLNDYFTPKALTFIEDVLHSVVMEAEHLDGRQGWLQHKIHLYYPDPSDIHYSVNFDGREGEAKYDEDMIF